MGATCLGKPRNNRQLMNIPKELDIKPKYISTHNSINQNKQLYVGQNEGNKLKIDSTLLSCTVCMQNYNTNSRQPVIICNNYHTFCKNCIQIIKNGNKQCPTCRLPLNQPIRNRDIYQLIEDNLKIIEEGKLEVIEAVQSKYIEVSVDMKNNPLINSFWVNQKRIMKIQNDKKWVGFVSQQILPRNRQCIYTVKIVHSQCNNIEIGIVAQGYILQSNVTAAQSVMYHLADGNVLANFGKKKNEWRKVGHPVEREKKIVLQVRVNGIQQSVSWWLGDTKLGQGRFGDWLIHQPCVAYVMMYHPEDVIQLNA